MIVMRSGMEPADLDPAENRLKDALASVPGIRLAFLFGSRARGRARSDSDFDLAVLVDDSLVAGTDERAATIRRLAGRLGREVSSAHLDLVILNSAPVLLRHRVLRDGVLLFQRSTKDRVRFATKTIQDYQDGEIRRERFLEKRIQRLRESSTDGGSGDLLEKARGVARLLGKAHGIS
jgi:predicted nucleotidyltransferase